MKFIATKPGFFGGSVRERGVTFDAPDNFKASWAVPAETAAAKAVKTAKVEKVTPRALSELAAPGKSFSDVHKGEDLA